MVSPAGGSVQYVHTDLQPRGVCRCDGIEL